MTYFCIKQDVKNCIDDVCDFFLTSIVVNDNLVEVLKKLEILLYKTTDLTGHATNKSIMVCKLTFSEYESFIGDIAKTHECEQISKEFTS